MGCENIVSIHDRGARTSWLSCYAREDLTGSPTFPLGRGRRGYFPQRMEWRGVNRRGRIRRGFRALDLLKQSWLTFNTRRRRCRCVGDRVYVGRDMSSFPTPAPAWIVTLRPRAELLF